MAKKTIRVATKDKGPLLLAVEHVELANGGPANYAPFCLFTPGWLVGYDGIVAAGARVIEDMIGLAPHTETLKHALQRAGNPYSLTIRQSGVVVRSDTVRVEIPLTNAQGIPAAFPDPPVAHVSEGFVNALAAVARIVTTRSDRVIASSVCVRHNSCVASNGNTIIEAYHGCAIPGQHLVPREFVDAVARIKQAATHVGFSANSFTVWFGPDKWVRCNVYVDPYPDTDVIFAQMVATCDEYRPLPSEWLRAVETLKPFLSTPEVLLNRHGFNTQGDELGASFNFEHFFPSNAYRMLPFDAAVVCGLHADVVAFNDNGLYWYGQQLRGVTRA